ncbi:MAG: enoyl-CoA hydratase/isomerase family protein [Candidatus Methylomirabilales bacterium]
MESCPPAQFVRAEVEAGVATLTIDRPPLNPLSHQLKDELAGWLERLAADPGVRCVLLHGAGGRAFSVGADIKEFPEVAARRLGRQHATQEHTLYNRIHFFPVPTLAAIEGHCLGGGLELALACDLRVASRTSQLGFPEVKLGLYPAGGGTERLPRLIGESRALELMYSGEPVDGEEAHRIGLVNRVAPAGGALTAARALARTIAARPGSALRTLKRVVQQGLCMDPLAAQQLSLQAIEQLFHGPEALEHVRAFLEKRPSGPR